MLRVYEGMFLLDSGKAGDWNAATAHVHGILKRYDATILESRKWDERRLAYDIKGHRRAVYMLAYFDVPRTNIDSIRHDLELSDMVIRYLFVVREKYQVEKPEPAEEKAEKAEGEAKAEPAAEATTGPAEAAPPASDEPTDAPAESTPATEAPSEAEAGPAADAVPAEAPEQAAPDAAADEPAADESTPSAEKPAE